MSTEVTESKVYFRGLPVAPDIERLNKALGQPAEGDLIPYETIEEIIGCMRNTFRFKTVTHSWRSELLRDHNIEVGVERGIGFVALTPTLRVKSGSKRVEHGLRGVFRGGKRLHLIDDSRLTGPEREIKTHRMMVASRIQQAAKWDEQRVQTPDLPGPCRRLCDPQ